MKNHFVIALFAALISIAVTAFAGPYDVPSPVPAIPGRRPNATTTRQKYPAPRKARTIRARTPITPSTPCLTPSSTPGWLRYSPMYNSDLHNNADYYKLYFFLLFYRHIFLIISLKIVTPVSSCSIVINSSHKSISFDTGLTY
jgi:hypothetical protein